MTAAAKSKIGEASKKAWQNPETRARQMERMKNVSPETRKKMSDSKAGKPSWNKGKAWSEESIEKMRQSQMGVVHSKESYARQSESLKATFTPERRAAVGAKSKGHTMSAESKAKVGVDRRVWAIVTYIENGQTVVTGEVDLRVFCDSRTDIKFATAYVAARNGTITKAGYRFKIVERAKGTGYSGS